MSTTLTVEELQNLINMVAQVNVPVIQAEPYQRLINKMSQMVDELRSPPPSPPKEMTPENV